MSKKPSLLQAAMKADRPAAPEPETQTPEPETVIAAAPARAPAASNYVAPSRAGKAAKTHYLPKPYWETLELLSFKTRDEQGKRVPQEKLVAEALNLLFLKHNYPPIREE